MFVIGSFPSPVFGPPAIFSFSFSFPSVLCYLSHAHTNDYVLLSLHELANILQLALPAAAAAGSGFCSSLSHRLLI